MKQTRREFVSTIVAASGALGILMAVPGRARACMYGEWVVRCPYQDCRNQDVVTEGTCQHVCGRCHRQMFNGDVITVVCPDGHGNPVHSGDAMRSWTCRTPGCGKECRRDREAKRVPDHDHDHGRP